MSRWAAVSRDGAIGRALLAMHRRHVGIAQPCRRFRQRIEYRLQIKSRTADNFEHVRGCRLLLKGLSQFREEPRILDGDHRLSCKVRHQFNLSITERSNFLPVNTKDSYCLLILKHWYNYKSPSPCKLANWFIGVFCRHVQNVARLPRINDTINVRCYPAPKDRCVFAKFLKFRRCVMHCDALVCITFAKQHVAKCRLANAGRVLQHSVEYRCKVTGRAADNAQHFRRRRLLLQRLPQLIEQPRVLDGDDGLGSEVLYQLNLLVGEWADFLAIDRNSADQFIVFEHWHHENGASAAHIDDSLNGRMALEVSGRRAKVFNLYQLLGPYYLGMTTPRMRSPPSHSETDICEFGWNIVRRYAAEYLAIVEVENAERGATQRSCVCQNGLKDRLQFCRRA